MVVVVGPGEAEQGQVEISQDFRVLQWEMGVGGIALVLSLFGLIRWIPRMFSCVCGFSGSAHRNFFFVDFGEKSCWIENSPPYLKVMLVGLIGTLS